MIKAHAQPHDTTDFGLTMYLSAFNRKERFFVFIHASGVGDAEALHAPSITLGSRMRDQLNDKVGINIPAHAYAATDYHLNWLYAALQWHAGITTPMSTPPFPLRAAVTDTGDLTAAHVDGTQEDADLIVAWADQAGDHVLIIEAKAYGAWSNDQWRSKLARLATIRAAATAVDIRFVLASPDEPRKLITDNLPDWAQAPHSSVASNWTRLPGPGLRVKTTRCTEDGQPSANGKHWRITPPSSR